MEMCIRDSERGADTTVVQGLTRRLLAAFGATIEDVPHVDAPGIQFHRDVPGFN